MAEPFRFRASLREALISNGVIELTFAAALTQDVAQLATYPTPMFSVLVIPDERPESAVEAAAPEPPTG